MNLKEIVVDRIKERREEGAGTEDGRDKAGGRVKRVGGKAVYACKSSVLTRCLLFFASPERVGVLRAPLYFIAKGNYICRYVYTNIHTYVRIYMYMYICICIYVCVCIHESGKRSCAHTYTCARGFAFPSAFVSLNSLRRIDWWCMHFSQIRSIHRKLMYLRYAYSNK